MPRMAVNFPEELKLELQQMARAVGVSESQLVLAFVGQVMAAVQVPSASTYSFELPAEVITLLKAKARSIDPEEEARTRKAVSKWLARSTAAWWEGSSAPEPRIPVFRSGEPMLAERGDEYLKKGGASDSPRYRLSLPVVAGRRPPAVDTSCRQALYDFMEQER